MKPIVVVPTPVDPVVERLMVKLGTSLEPMLVKVDVHPMARPQECFANVDSVVRDRGGERLLGWSVWKGEFLAEAEFHAVWKSPGGEVKDVTPNYVALDSILFIADPVADFDGAQVDNVRINITDNRLVDDLIDIRREIYRIENRGERRYMKEVRLEGEESYKRKFLDECSAVVFRLLKEGYGRNARCSCGSGNRYKHCHGKKLAHSLR